MEKLTIPDYDELPLDDIAAGVAGLRILFVNVFALTSSLGGWVLVDSGLPLSAGRIRKWAAERHGDVAPRSIIQTHGHFDHTGALKELADTWDVPIYAHELEMPFLTGQSQYPPPDTTVGGGLMPLMSSLFPRGQFDARPRVRALAADGHIAGLPGWNWIHTPGHTAGHVSLFREEDRALIVGDAFCTTDMRSVLAAAGQRPELHGPPPYYTPDWDQAEASVKKLAQLRPAILAPGHGLPMSGVEVDRALHELAAHFQSIARPETAVPTS